jgi:hypothetical protein
VASGAVEPAPHVINAVQVRQRLRSGRTHEQQREGDAYRTRADTFG